MSATTPEVQVFKGTKTEDKAATKDEKVQDGFRNFAEKLGISPKGECADNTVSGGHYEFNLITRNRVQLEAAYRGSWIVGKMIDVFAQDMTRAGVTITTDEGAEKLQELKAAMSRLKIFKSVCSTIKWGKLYGGAVGVVQIKGQKPDTPLDLETIGKGQFKGIVVYDRWQLYPVLSDLIEEGPDMGLPKYYDIVLGSNLNDPGHELGSQISDNPNGRVRVHHSRCIRMIGVELPFWQAITEMMWGESSLERIWDRLIMFDDITANAINLVQKAYLRRVGINGLREILAAGGAAEEALVAQFEYMRKFQNNEGVTLLDKEDEWAAASYNFSGLADIIMQFGQQVSGGIDIPLIRLFGQSPAGLNATGEADLRLYYDGVNAQQEADLRVFFDLLIKILWRSCFGVAAPSDLTFNFTPLWQMSATDKATVAQTNTNTIVVAHQEGLVDTPTAMKELKQTSGETGLFSHITTEQIEEAESEAPPAPGEELGELEAEPGAPGEGPARPADKIKKAATGDSIIRKIRGLLGQKQVTDRGVEETMKEFAKGKLKSSSGKKVTSKKQALAIGYSEERADDSKVSDAQKIKDWLAKQ